MEVEVRVPATSANLGPGFDCLGVALGIYLRIRISEADRPEIAGVGRHHPLERNLTYRSLVSAFGRCGIKAPSVRLETLESYPSARGLGASAAAIVAGIVGARSLGNLNLSDRSLADLGCEIEGHADNVLPALFGGLMLKMGTGYLRFDPSPSVVPLVLIARDRFKTGKARQVLPAQVSRSDAVAAAASTAGLVATLSGHAGAEHIMDATQDRLHEPYRLPLMPKSGELHRKLRAAGIPTALSGAGPSLICLVQADQLDGAADVLRSLLPEGWRFESPGWDLEGAKVS